MGMSPRTQYISMTSLVLVLLAGLIIGLTLGLHTPALENGGSPEGPPRYNNDTTITSTTTSMGTTTTPSVGTTTTPSVGSTTTPSVGSTTTSVAGTTTTTPMASTTTTPMPSTTTTPMASTTTTPIGATTTSAVGPMTTTSMGPTTASSMGPTTTSDDSTGPPLDLQDEPIDIVIITDEDMGNNVDKIREVKTKVKQNTKQENNINKDIIHENRNTKYTHSENDIKEKHNFQEIEKGASISKKKSYHKDRGIYVGEEWKSYVRVDDPLPWPASATKSFKYAAVTTDTIPCSTIGTDILGQGGSAVDAAVAAGLCVGVVNHHNSGLGGGHFMTIYEKPRGSANKELNTIQAREWAPLAATRDMFVNNTGASSKGGLAIAVPGEVKGFYIAWERYGVLPWSDLFQPSIQLCEQGFTVEKSLSGAIEDYEEKIRADPNLSELFVKEDGTLVTEGDLLKNPKLGVTLSRIAQDPHTFYNGSLADDIVADLAEYGSIITKNDLLAYMAKLKPAITVPLSNGNLTAYSVRPPSSGAIIEFIINILNGYNFIPSLLDVLDDKILTYHRIVEAYKFAYAKRSNLGDEDFVDVEDLLVNLTSPAYGEYIRSRINDSSTQNYTYYEPDFDIVTDGGTCHMSVQTSDGSAVAMTMTINLFFGSNVRGNRTAIIFNDEMDDFSTPGTVNEFGVPASPANYIVPGKMPMSSMCPTLIFDNKGNIVFSSGASGGTRITTATAFVAMQSLWFNQTLTNATDSARIHHQLIPEDVKYEPHLSQEIIDGLKAKNHMTTLYGNIANVQSIYNACPYDEGDIFTDDCIYATSDGRKGGAPDGMS